MTQIIRELGYLGFEVSDMPRWERFATEVLGVGVFAGPSNTLRLRTDAKPARFILSEGPANDVAYSGWRVDSAADLEAFSAHLRQQSIAYAWASDDELAVRHAERMLHFTDPVGNRHEAYVAAPGAETPWQSPLVASGFVTGAGGAGHVVYETDRYPETIDFVNNVLQLGLSDNIHLQPVPEVKIEVSFFHANERHHSLAVAPRAPGPGAGKRIHHFMLEVADMADVGRARDRCLEFGQPVVMDIGQHPNDHMISFYGLTPSGFLFEFGWGGVKVDTATWQTGAYNTISTWGHRPFGLKPGEAPAMPPAAQEIA